MLSVQFLLSIYSFIGPGPDSDGFRSFTVKYKTILKHTTTNTIQPTHLHLAYQLFSLFDLKMTCHRIAVQFKFSTDPQQPLFGH